MKSEEPELTEDSEEDIEVDHLGRSNTQSLDNLGERAADNDLTRRLTGLLKETSKVERKRT